MNKRFILTILLIDRRIRIRIHPSDLWIRIHEVQKLTEPTDHDSDSEHCINVYLLYCTGTEITTYFFFSVDFFQLNIYPPLFGPEILSFDSDSSDSDLRSGSTHNTACSHEA
jgi:hypothetical protein